MNITPSQHDLLKELINIGVGKAAGLINQMVSTHVELDLPEVRLLDSEGMAEYLGRNGTEILSTVRLGFRGALSGWAGLVFPKPTASWLVSQLIGQELGAASMDLDSLRIGTIQEVGNIVLNGIMGSIVNILGVSVDYFPPDYFETGLSGLFAAEETTTRVVMFIKARFRLEDKDVEGDILILFHVDTFQDMLAALDRLLLGNTPS
ncbi:MAG: chemotaxis protein CheC [Acidobacteriota bacterium]